MVEKKRVLIDAMGPELCSLGLLLSLCSVPICAFPRISTLICLSLVPVPIACSCILGWFQPPLCFLVPTRFTLFLAILFVCLTCLLVHTGLFLIGDLGRIVAMAWWIMDSRGRCSASSMMSRAVYNLPGCG